MNHSNENKTLTESFPEEVDIQFTKNFKSIVLNVLKQLKEITNKEINKTKRTIFFNKQSISVKRAKLYKKRIK